MRVKAIVEDVGPFKFAAPAYEVDGRALSALQAARGSVNAQPCGEDDSLDRAASAIYPGFKPLTLALAKRLTGTTVPAVSGQRWMDFKQSGTRKQRASQVHLTTVHGVFETGPQRERDAVCVVTVLGLAAPVRTATFQTYLWRGCFGSGSGHDPVFVCAS